MCANRADLVSASFPGSAVSNIEKLRQEYIDQFAIAVEAPHNVLPAVATMIGASSNEPHLIVNTRKLPAPISSMYKSSTLTVGVCESRGT